MPPRLDELARQADRPHHTWAQAIVERIRGLMAPDDEVDEHFARALEFHGKTRQPFETARTQLLHGERLRRAKRRADARTPLGHALAVFERLGAEPWAERARAELRATGGPTGSAAPAIATDELTAQELQIALQVAQGRTNREVAAALFLSAKTIEYHLGSIYRKLGIRRRGELAGVLAGFEAQRQLRWAGAGFGGFRRSRGPRAVRHRRNPPPRGRTSTAAAWPDSRSTKPTAPSPSMPPLTCAGGTANA